jgi:hypothetical protein
LAVAVVILAVLSAGAFVALVLTDRARRAATKELAASRALGTSLQAQLDATRAEVARGIESEASVRLELEESQRQVAVAEARIDELSVELNRAANGHDPVTLWRLEMMRSERTWRNHVAPGPDFASPLAESDNQLRSAIEIEAGAIREESGTAVRVMWEIAGPLDPGPSLAVLRNVQELLGQLAKTAERLALRVSLDGDQVVIAVRVAEEYDEESVSTAPWEERFVLFRP